MARKRRIPKMRSPRGLADISKTEVCHWTTYGPDIGGSGPFCYPTWADWAAVYETSREELLEKLKERRSRLFNSDTLSRQLDDEPQPPACEVIFQAIKAGQDPAEAQEKVLKALPKNDPRKILKPNLKGARKNDGYNRF